MSAADFKFNDLWQYDPVSFIWTELTSSIQGIAPAQRDKLGLAAVGEKLYIFGGNGGTSTSLYGDQGWC